MITPTTTIRVPAGDDHLLRIGRQLSDLIGIAAGPKAPAVEAGTAQGAAGGIHLQLGDVPARRRRGV